MPASLTQPCTGVVDIPARGLSTAETVRLWGRDRQSLGDCQKRHGALVKSVGALVK